MRVLILLSAVLPAGLVLAANPMTILYEERPPYQMRVGDVVEGLTAVRAAEAFKSAGIPFVWQVSSMSRQMHMLRQNETASCTVGLFKNRERLQFAKFTKPIYRDAPIAAIVRRQFSVGASPALADVLATPGLRVLVRGKYSYGSKIDDALGRIKPHTIASPQPNSQLVALLRAGRADLMFAAEEEAAVLLRQAAGEELQMLRFADIEQGEERHIACSNKVPDDLIDRLNKAIDAK